MEARESRSGSLQGVLRLLFSFSCWIVLFSFLCDYLRSMKIGLSIFLFCGFMVVFAQVPPGYYDPAQGLSGEALRTALHNIIDDHDVQSYGDLWDHFEATDNKGGNKVWDMYSDQPGGMPDYEYNFGSDQCGSYGGEGDCFNREHSFPQSWYGNGSPMESDLFHVYPTDGYVNGQRDNDPFGEVDIPFWTSSNGSKSGPNSFPGFNGNVFEPIDEYKGDLARSYFYMLTRYLDISNGWSSPMLVSGDLAEWAAAMLVQWHIDDPVSIKELDRNNAVHDIQDNRNPYIDHPEWVVEVWPVFVGVESAEVPRPEIWYANGWVYCNHPVASTTLSLFSAMGQHIQELGLSNGPARLDVPAGVYYLVEHGHQHTLKIIVGH